MGRMGQEVEGFGLDIYMSIVNPAKYNIWCSGFLPALFVV